MARRNGAGGEAPEERRRRPEPARERPKRALYAKPETIKAKADGASAKHPADSAEGADDVIGSAVSAAYRVVEENLQEGRRAAERLRAAAQSPSDPAPDAKAVANRLLHITKEMGTTWVDLILAVLRESDVRALLDRVAAPDRTRAEPADAAQMPIVQRISSRKPVEVTLSPLSLRNLADAPGIAGLHSLDASSPPITGVAFTVRAAGGMQVSITVPDDQPAGVYSGTVMDVDSLQPIGTLSLRVLG